MYLPLQPLNNPINSPPNKEERARIWEYEREWIELREECRRGRREEFHEDDVSNRRNKKINSSCLWKRREEDGIDEGIS